jgi:hypothetical protein
MCIYLDKVFSIKPEFNHKTILSLNKENRHPFEKEYLFSALKLVYYLPILNILVPQVGHTPWVAGLPFFMVMDLAFFISFLARHLTQ